MKRIFALLLSLLLLSAACAMAETEGAITPRYDVMIIPVGESMLARHTVTPAKLSKGGVTYESSDESIAAVNKSGYVRGVSEGECVVTITCKKDPSVTASMPVQIVIPAKKVRASVESTTMNAGETQPISWSLSPEEATLQKVTYSSSKESVATVDENGVITAHARGTTNVVVKSADGGAQSRIEITVRQLPEAVEFLKEEYTMAVGRKLKFKTTVQPANANDRKLIWSSSDESIAKVDSTGSVTAREAGDVIITATAQADETVSGSVLVHCVRPVKSVTFEKDVYDLYLDETVQLVPIVSPENATVSALRYEPENPSVCTVDKNGLVTAQGSGETMVAVISTENGKELASMKVRVNVPITSAWLDQKGVRLEVGTHTFLTVKIRPADASNKDMIWVSSDERVASVTNQSYRPRIEGHAWGRCTLTGTTVDGGFTVSVNVNVGALHEALQVQQATIQNGQALVTLHNASDMHMSGAALGFTAQDGSGNEIAWETDLLPLDLPAGASAEVTIPLQAEKALLSSVALWQSDTGYYTNDDVLKNDYRISGGTRLWCAAK